MPLPIIGLPLPMPALGLALLALYGALAFGVRMIVQVRRTGSTGFKGLRGASGLERIGGLLFALAVVLCVAGPVLQLADTVSSVEALDGESANVLGVVLASLGIATTSVAQFAMGDAWRIGVDPSERTELVTHGPFSVVRNPIYAAMIPSFMGIALLAPNAVTVAGAALLMVALELQTRLIEEPYLSRVHGERYAVYAVRAGRFLPGVGRLRPNGKRL
jgi:protein-S-isoprenylcysteine O-methyltransferase Ste14